MQSSKPHEYNRLLIMLSWPIQESLKISQQWHTSFSGEIIAGQEFAWSLFFKSSYYILLVGQKYVNTQNQHEKPQSCTY